MMKSAIKLRHYQEKAIKAIYSYFRAYEGNPLIVLPTGTGKSIVIGEFTRGAIEQWPDTRIINATHNQELVKQNYLELCELWPMAPAGINSAGLNRRQTQEQILFVGIQSVYKKAYEIQRCDILMIDEAHTISEESDTMWQQFIGDLLIINPDMKIVGLTATDFRMKTGHLTSGENPIFTDVAYKYNILQAMQEGYLCNIIPKNMDTQFDLKEVHMRGGEFIPGELERAVNVDAVTKAAIDEVFYYGQNRNTWLLFCAGVDHAEAVAKEINSRGVECGVITGDTPKPEREEILRRFKAGELRAVTNNNVMTTGTNVPRIDLIAGLRPTGSAGLHIQMLGRGTRPIYADGFDLDTIPGRLEAIAQGPKPNCLYLDFARNAFRHGPLDKIEAKNKVKGEGEAPMKVCEATVDGPDGNKILCSCICYAGVRICPDCGTPFPEPELKINGTSDTAPITSDQIMPEWTQVLSVDYRVHSKEKDGKISKTMRVVYTTLAGMISEWVCYEHDRNGFAWKKAKKWHYERSMAPIPATVEEAVALREHFTKPTRIQFKMEGKFHRITAYDFALPLIDKEAKELQYTPAEELEDFEIPF